MDLNKALRELFEEKRRLDRIITGLEKRVAGVSKRSGISRRGRKSMGPAERLEVSRRMRAYWAARRAAVSQISNGS